MNKPRLDAPGAASLIVRRLSALARLSPSDEALLSQPRAIEERPGGVEIYPEGVPLPATWLISGWACRARMLSDGRRQILDFILPGDGMGLTLRPRRRSLCSIVTLTNIRTFDASAAMSAVASEDPAHAGLAEAVNRGCTLDEKRLMEQVVRLGRRTAYERVCHLFLELHERHAAVGLADGASIELPLTQEVLADATGLSMVHVNRTLQQLRRDRLIELKSGVLTLLDPTGMAEIAEYQPLYDT